MIVCSCNVLSDQQVRAAANASAPRLTSQVYGCLGCSAQCGRCARTIRRILDQVLTKCPNNCADCPRGAHAHHADAAHDEFPFDEVEPAVA